MDLYPLIPPGLTERADRGEARAIIRGRRSIPEVLERARLEMEAEDELEDYRKDPLAYVRAHRPCRTLGQRLLHGKARR